MKIIDDELAVCIMKCQADSVAGCCLRNIEKTPLQQVTAHLYPLNKRRKTRKY